jgi:hypothetical protein
VLAKAHILTWLMPNIDSGISRTAGTETDKDRLTHKLLYSRQVLTLTARAAEVFHREPLYPVGTGDGCVGIGDETPVLPWGLAMHYTIRTQLTSPIVCIANPHVD